MRQLVRQSRGTAALTGKEAELAPREIEGRSMVGRAYAEELGSGGLGRLLLNGGHGCSRLRPFARLQPVC